MTPPEPAINEERETIRDQRQTDRKFMETKKALVTGASLTVDGGFTA